MPRGNQPTAVGSQPANTVYAAPNGAAGNPAFRAIVADDIPTLNQNTTGTASKATNIAGGAANSLPYQSAPAATALLAANSTATPKSLHQVLSGAPAWLQNTIVECSDYETGTFTPTFTCATPGNLTFTYSSRVGRYTRVGNRVDINVVLFLTSYTHTSASGNVIISGLPFVSATNSQQVEGVLQGTGFTKVGYTSFAAQVAQTKSSVDVVASSSGLPFVQLVIGDFPTAGTPLLKFSLTYFI